MKIKNIAAICKKDGSIYLINVNDSKGERLISQWIGSGSAWYKASGLPRLDEGGVYTIFDIPEKDRKKVVFWLHQNTGVYNLDDFDESEIPTDKLGFPIIYGGRTLIAYKSVRGISYLDSSYLTPLNDSENDLSFFERTASDGRVYIAVKAGMLILAVIEPYGNISEFFCKVLSDMSIYSRAELNRRNGDED